MATELLCPVPHSYEDVLKFMGDANVVQIGPHTHLVRQIGYVEATFHGTTIVYYRPDSYGMTLAGWNKTTTRSRLSSLTPTFVHISKGDVYFGWHRLANWHEVVSVNWPVTQQANGVRS